MLSVAAAPTVAVITLALSPATVAQALPQIVPEIQTLGTTNLHLSPDQAVVSIAIAAHGSTASAASLIIRKPTHQVRDTLFAFGFPRDSVQVVSFGVGPNYDYRTAGDCSTTRPKRSSRSGSGTLISWAACWTR